MSPVPTGLYPPVDDTVHLKARIRDLEAEVAGPPWDRVRELEAALREAASTLQDITASCRAFEHFLAATAAETCEQHIRAVLGSAPETGAKQP